VPGGEQEAEDMFDDLIVGAVCDTPPGYPGQRYKLPGGGHVGYRPVSKSGPPTIDINITGIPIKKIKFV
jgi:hypothetical protein